MKINNIALRVEASLHFFPTTTDADPGFGQGEAQDLRPKVANVVKCSRTSEASNLQLGSRAYLRDLEAFGLLMLKYAVSHILEILFSNV